jgi:hypothetical protein
MTEVEIAILEAAKVILHKQCRRTQNIDEVLASVKK